MSRLEDLVPELSESDSSLLALPLGHLTSVRTFRRILNRGYLNPQRCKNFKCNLLYFSYGGIFHRLKNQSTRNGTELPVAFLFSPKLLTQIHCYYPYDTGAAYKRRYGSYSEILCNFDNYGISSLDYHLPLKLVYNLYGSNRNYLRGYAHDRCKNMPEPIPTLYNFYTTDLSSEQIDHRQLMIECLSTSRVFLKDYLIWVGFPDSLKGDFLKWCMKDDLPVIPDYYEYDSSIIENPYSLSRLLMERAKDMVVRRYLGSAP